MRKLIIVLTLYCSGCGWFDHVAEGALYPFKMVNDIGFEMPGDVVELDTPEFYAWELPGDGPLIVYLHGNGESLTTLNKYGMLNRLHSMGHVIAVEYPGINPVPGPTNEAALVASAVGALNYAHSLYPDKPLVLWGRSLGSSVAVQAASRVRVDRLILVSVFKDFLAVAKASPMKWLLWLVSDRFISENNYDSMAARGKIYTSGLVVHGEKDEIMPMEQGEEVAKALDLWFQLVPDKGHNDIYLDEVTWIAINKIFKEIK